jgi:two-component system, NarL family, response regulator NreC
VTDRIRVLISEDHALFREGLRALLSAHPTLEVVGDARDGNEAVQLAKSLRPDVILMDMEMPELNGLEATRRVRRAVPASRVLMLTLYDDEEVVAECLEAGAAGYVLKDAPSSQLVYAIEAVHRGQRYLSPRVLGRVVEGNGRHGKSAKTSFDLLTPREREVLRLLAEGHSVKQIALRLGLSVKTVDVHKSNLMRKLDLHDRSELVKYALRRKLIRLPSPGL